MVTLVLNLLYIRGGQAADEQVSVILGVLHFEIQDSVKYVAHCHLVVI